MADGAGAEGEAAGETAARGAALERAYVHDVYEQAGDDNDEARALAPGVSAFLQDLDPGSLVCDVGCGNGKYLNINPSVFCVGGDRCIRLTTQARHHNNEVVACDNLSLPYRDESFDAVLSIAVVHHFATVERRAMALRELARVTRIGGRLLLTVWAMEHEGRNFHSQDVLIPWHRPATLCPPAPTPRFLSVDNEQAAEAWKTRDGSPGSSSLSSPNETCYSFVRRALQRLAGRRSFLPSWNANHRIPTRSLSRPEPLAVDLPIELRRLDEAFPPRLMPQASESSTVKSRSLTDIADIEHRSLARSRSSLPSLSVDESARQPSVHEPPTVSEVTEPRRKPRLVKQKKSINEDDADEDLDKPTDMKSMVEEMPNFKIHTYKLHSKKPGVFKQTSLNEELMSVERLREKEHLRRNIQKQASLNDEYLYHRPGALDSIRDSIFSTSATTAKKFQSLKNGLTSKFKTSTTNIDKVTVFVRMLQGWKSHGHVPEVPTPNDNNPTIEKTLPERRHSKEDGSDSSKDSSLQSDTSVDSEDSFASVIYVPKADGTSDPLSPTPLSPGPTSPRLKVSSVPTSPRMKNAPGLPSPRIKQAFPLIRPPPSPNAVSTPGNVNKILVAQYSLKNFNTSPVSSVPLKPQSKSQPNSPPKSESDDTILKPEIPKHTVMNNINIPIELDIFEDIPDLISPIKEEEESPTDVCTKELIAEINKDIEELHKLTAETENLKPRVLQDAKPYPKITLQTVAELPEIPQFKPKDTHKTTDLLDSRTAERKRKERLRQIKDIVNKGIPSASYSRRAPYPIVRCTNKAEPIAKSHPKLMSLELFNPATDDVDSDSSGVSSPDSVDSVISVVPDELRKIAMEKDLPNSTETLKQKTEPSVEKSPVVPAPQTLIEAVAKVANSLDDTCETVIQSSPTSKRKNLEKLESTEAIAIIQGNSSSSSSSNWSLNKLSPGDLRILEDRSRSSHTSSSGSSSSLERLSPGRRSKDRSPKLGSTSNSTWSLNRLSPNRPEGRSLDENLSKPHRSPTRLPFDSASISSTDSEKSISKSESFNRVQANEPLVTCKSDMLAKEEEWMNDQQDRSQHLTEFAEKLSEKLLQQIDQYSKRINEEDFDLPSSSSSERSISLRLKREEEDRNTQKILDELSDSLQHLEEPFMNKLGNEMQNLNKLNQELQDRNKYTNLNETQETDINKLFPKCCSKSKSKKRSKDVDPIINKYRELKKTMKVTSEEDIYLNNCANLQFTKPIVDEKLTDLEIKNPDDDSAICSSNGNPEITIDSGTSDTSQSLETGYSLESEMSVDSLCTSTDKRSSLKVGQSTDSSELDKMEISPESVTSRSSASTAPLKSGFSIESSDTSAGSDWSRRDKTGSTASLGCASLASLPSCSECSKERKLLETRSSSEDTATVPIHPVRAGPHAPLLPSLSDGSDSLPSEGGAVTYHRYYHVFKRGELDQLIEKYVESLHVVSSYYDQASWCVVAEKVQVWTI